MSLTEADTVYGAIREEALNDLMTAVFTTRPHYLNYGSPPFVNADSAAATRIEPLPFPGSGGIPWAVSFAIPHLDLHPDTAGSLPPQLVLGPGQFALTTTVTLAISCGGKPDGERNAFQQTKLDVAAIGHLVVVAESVSLAIDAVELVDITPDSLESLVECLIKALLNGALSGLVLPVQKLIPTFPLVLTRGPQIVNDQIKAYGKTN